MSQHRAVIPRSPRKQPVVAQAVLDIYSIHPFLEQDIPSNNTARRIKEQLEELENEYTDHFLRFVEQERQRKEDEAVIEEQKRNAARATGARGPPRLLRRMVGPLVELEGRLRDAMEQAQQDVMAMYGMEDISQSLGSRRAIMTPGFPLEDDCTSPSKRSSSKESTGSQAGIKRQRVAHAGHSVSVPTRLPGTAVRATGIIIPESPPYSIQDYIAPVTPKQIVAPKTRAAERAPGSITWTAGRLAPDACLNPAPGYQPPRTRDPSELYLVVTPKQSLQAYMNKHIPFHTQYELAHCLSRIRRHAFWEKVRIDDLEPLSGPPTISAPRVIEVVREVNQRVKLQQRRVFSRTNTSTMTISLAQPATGSVDREMQKVRREAELEDADIATGKMAGMSGQGVKRDRPYGGQITYSFLIEPASDKDARVKLLQPEPPASPADQYRCPIASHPVPSTPGPTDDPDNPLGIMSNQFTTDFPFAITVQAPRLAGKSFRLARTFGSRRILSFKVSKKIKDRHKVKDMLLGRVLLVLGRTYRAFWATPEGDNVFAVETGDVMPIGWRRVAEQKMPSWMDMMARFNDPRLKPGQAMAKWSARPQLLFSDTVPVCQVTATAVTIIPDEIASCAEDPSDPATEEILTDGCGLMSRTLAESVRHYTQLIGLAPLARMPSAIQMRYGGSKGLLLLMSPEQEAKYAGKDIVLRHSMVKSHADPKFAFDVSVLTLDLVQHSNTAFKLGTSLSAEPMTIMHAQGVRRSTFVALQKAKLDEIGMLLKPEPQVMEDTGCMEDDGEMLSRLRKNVYVLGGVGLDRQKRRLLGKGTSLKVAGLRGRMASSDGVEAEEEPWELDSDNDEAASEVSGLSRSTSIVSGLSTAAFEVNALNGLPASPAEALYEALSSGFTHQESPFIRDKLRSVVTRLTDSIVRTFKIPLERSLTAFIVPDPTGLLAPDEVYISLSQPFTDPDTGTSTLNILGPVLALRSPCKLPTDVQKMQAVYIPQLAHLTDVIVMSADAARCSRSPASMLGGGDYDGDTVLIIWEPSLVEPFQNADPVYADTPRDFIQENFEKELVTVREVLEKTEDMASEAGIGAMQKFLLGGIEGDFLTGKYSEMHGNAVYELGVSHPETLRLARMFCHVLDARKSGLTVRKAILKQDETRWSGKLDWRDFKKGKTDAVDDGRPARKRGTGMGTFILDELQQQGNLHAKAVLSQFEKSDAEGFQLKTQTQLRNLAALWDDLTESVLEMTWTGRTVDDADELASDAVSEGMQADIATIERHVCAVIKTWETLRCNPDPAVVDRTYESYMETVSFLGGDPTDEPDGFDTEIEIKPGWVSEKEGFPGTILHPKEFASKHVPPRSAAGTPTRRTRKPDQYRTKEEKKRDSQHRRSFDDKLVQLWHSLDYRRVSRALMGFRGEQAQMRLRELMVARAAKEGKWAKHAVFLFEMDFEATCAIKARTSCGNDEDGAVRGGGSGSVVRKREAWEDSKPSAKRGRY